MNINSLTLLKKIRNSKIKTRIIIYSGLTFTFILAIIIGLGGIRMHQTLIEKSESHILQNVLSVSLEIEKQNIEAVALTKTMALAQENGLFGNRESSLKYIKAIVESDLNITGSCYGYEPNADGKDLLYRNNPKFKDAHDKNGRFIPYWYRNQTNPNLLILTQLIDMETSLYYQGNKERWEADNNFRYIITEPYIYEGKMIVEYTHNFIINGEFKGISSIDRALTDINNYLLTLKPFQTSEFILISSRGNIISCSIDTTWQTKHISEVPIGNILEKLYNNKNKLIETVYDETSKKNYFYASQNIQEGDWTLVTRVERDEVLQPLYSTIYDLLIFSIFGLVIAIIIFIIISNSITNPILIAVNSARKVADGDLRDKIIITRRDETGELLNSIKIMTNNLNTLVKQVQQSSIQVKASVNMIDLTSKRQESQVNDFGTFTTEVVATAKQISATSSELVSIMKNLSETSKETGKSAFNEKENLDLIEKSMNELVSATNKIANKLAVLNEKANNVSKVITTINKIADQTNLLSLNAAIEAEKAGEFGQGFAVVASEIRRLSDQTAQSTIEIEDMIKEMQTAVISGVVEMNKFTEVVSNSSDQVSEMSKRLNNIIEEVQSLPPRFEEVNDNVQMQADGAKQITKTILELNTSAKQAIEYVSEFKKANSQLNEAVQFLQAEISLFKVGEENNKQNNPSKESREES